MTSQEDIIMRLLDQVQVLQARLDRITQSRITIDTAMGEILSEDKYEPQMQFVDDVAAAPDIKRLVIDPDDPRNRVNNSGAWEVGALVESNEGIVPGPAIKGLIVGFGGEPPGQPQGVLIEDIEGHEWWLYEGQFHNADD